jgi:hypothetical protein
VAEEHVLDDVQVVAERQVLTVAMPSASASRGVRLTTGSPFHDISPVVGCQIPEMVLIIVDLPAPLSPTSAVILPAMMSKSTPRSACTAPKLLEMPRRLSSG